MTTVATGTEVQYQVECANCGQVFTPAIRSPLWWKAKKRDEKGFLDAYRCTGIECGCEQARHEPDAPFRVSGYTDDCRNFDIPFDTFTPAVKQFKEMTEAGMYVVFISGVSDAVRKKIEYPW